MWSWQKKLRETGTEDDLQCDVRSSDRLTVLTNLVGSKKASAAAEAEWRKRAEAACKKLEAEDQQPAYKITREPNGGFMIHRKFAESKNKPWTIYDKPSAEYWESLDAEAWIVYRPLQDYKNPIKSDLSYYITYPDLIFNTRREAESYLRILAEPVAQETHYDATGKRIKNHTPEKVS